MRNHYYNKSSDNQKFINAFGVYFEMYVEELLNNCLAENNYERITECGRKRADWKLQLGDYEFLVEQKSSLSLLGIKQTQPDIKKFKEHIIKCWGKAVIQLNETEKDLKLSSPIKIILLYEDYYKSECLDLLFEYDDYVDYYDGKYWLVTINEFEMLIKLYKDNPDLFFTVIKEKDESELNKSNKGREPLRFLRSHGIYENSYLEEFHIYDQFTKVQNLTKKHQ